MLKASALYLVIIIALVIGLICSSMIVAAYFYKNQYQRKARYDLLENNLNSGINILVTAEDTAYSRSKTFSLFGGDADSVSLKKSSWGVYDIGIAFSFIQKDSLFKSFSMANTIDSSKWAAVYLIDEDRPFSLSGKTSIRGDAYIPKAGVQEAYIDNKAYQGDKRLIIGKRHLSDKTLPILNAGRLKDLTKYFLQKPAGDSTIGKTDSIHYSFLQPTHYFNFKKQLQSLQSIRLSGNIILLSDTSITIDSTAILNNVLVFARAITVKSGFHGNCQLFATDSIHLEARCSLNYPSCLGIVRAQSTTLKTQEKISIDDHTDFNGIIFTYEKNSNPLKPSVSIGKNVKITGQIYSQGILELKDQSEVDGSVFTGMLYYRNSFTIFENYLINTTIDSKALSSYYLTSDLLPVAKKRKKVLQWMEAN